MQKKFKSDKYKELVDKNPHSTFFRTLLRSDVLDRLTEFSKQFSTGANKWDYGVAFQVLLDFYDYHNKIATVQEISQKLDYLLEQLPQKQKEEDTKKVIKMLGGHDIKLEEN